MMEGSPSLWNMNIPRPPSQKTSSHPFTSPSSSSSTSSPFNQYPQPSNSLPMIPCLDSQELPDSWRQLLLGEEEDRCSFTPFQPKRMEGYDHDHQVLYQSGSAQKVHVKQEISQEAGFVYGQRNEEFQPSWSSWSQTLPTSSPRSCITTSFNSSMLDFSNCKAERRNHQLDHSSECNSTATGSAFKKSRVQPSSTQSIFKVRKEKLGDRITALHQLVSPFGKTDTASVLLEAIGYIRFLQSQIQALSSPYLGGESGSMMQFAQGERSCIFPEDPGQLLNDPRMRRRGPCDQGGNEEPKKSLRSRGLCLVPMAFMLHVGSQNAADY